MLILKERLHIQLSDAKIEAISDKKNTFFLSFHTFLVSKVKVDNYGLDLTKFKSCKKGVA